MTQLEVSFSYGTTPGEREMRAIDSMRGVYGIRRVCLDQPSHRIRVEYDASRLKEPVVAALLRRAGVDLRESKV